MNNKPAAYKLAFEYLRRMPEKLSPADYIKKFEQLESEFRTLLDSSKSQSKFTICQLLSRLCAKR
ncbi:YdiH family protein [Candidatus Palibaumannia cicadellinicola]|uniref:Uncharacterized protein n=1 Tax=Candidatus Palibaumannia cicadellinicola TaxID=186490 RepID=A0A088MXZ6_9GAMM|nr:YdiH family protein [Candidatus Baumannia cicadellinicola]AIN47172.1 hypothetical protein IM45_593 [Candidatus Baumannia cicadellinicola]